MERFLKWLPMALVLVAVSVMAWAEEPTKVPPDREAEFQPTATEEFAFEHIQEEIERFKLHAAQFRAGGAHRLLLEHQITEAQVDRIAFDDQRRVFYVIAAVDSKSAGVRHP